MATVGSDRYVEIGQRLLIAVVILIFTFALPWFLWEQFMPQEEQTPDELASVSLAPTEETTPALEFISSPLTAAVAGQPYRYRPQINYTGEETVRYTIEQKPSWLTWNAQELVLSGTAPKNQANGQAQLVRLIAQAGEHTDEQTFTISISATSPTPTMVAGSTTDPFAARPVTPKGEVLGAADLPDTAISPVTWMILSLATIAVGIVVIRWQWQNHFVYKLNTGARLEVKSGRTL